MDGTPTPSTPPSVCPPAPVATRRTTENIPTPSQSHTQAQYGLFLADLAFIDRTSLLPEIRTEVDKSLAQFNTQTADKVRFAYVADTSKFRKTRKMVEKGLSTPQKRQLRNITTAKSRRRCAEKLSLYHAKLDELCQGRRSWLPQGIDINELSYDTVLNLRKIIEWSLKHSERLDRLWEPGGHLHDVPYKKKPLDDVWKRLSQRPSSAASSSHPNNESYQQDETGEPHQNIAQDREEEDGLVGVNGGGASHPHDAANLDNDSEYGGGWSPNDDADSTHYYDSDVATNKAPIEQARRAHQAQSNSRSVSMELDNSFLFSRAKSSPAKDAHGPGDDSLFTPHSLSTTMEEQCSLAPTKPQENLLQEDSPGGPRPTLGVSKPDTDGHVPLVSNTPPPLTPPHSATPPRPSSLPHDLPLPPAVNTSGGSSVGMKRQRSTSTKAVLASALVERDGQASYETSNAPKRSRVAKAPERFDLRARYGFNAECLADGQNVEGTAISEILNTVCALCPLSMMHLDPLTSNTNIIPTHLRDDFLAQKGMTILYPLNLTSRAKHWVLVAASATSVRIFDSLPSATDEDELNDLLRVVLSLVGEATAPEIPPTPTCMVCPQQSNATDCGVAVIVNALYVIADQRIPATVDYSIWRRVLLIFSTGVTTITGTLPEDLAQPVSVSNHGVPLPPPPPTIMTEADFTSWDKQYREYRQMVTDHACAQLDVKRARQQQMMSTLEDVAVIFGALQRSGLSSTAGMDQIQEELANCHSALQSLSRLRRDESSMIAGLKSRCARLADAQRRRTMMLMELARVVRAISNHELLDNDSAASYSWHALDT